MITHSKFHRNRSIITAGPPKWSMGVLPHRVKGENRGECKIYGLSSYLYPSMITHTKFHRNRSIITAGPPKWSMGVLPHRVFGGSYEDDPHDQFCRSHHFKHLYIHQVPQNQNIFQVMSLRQFQLRALWSVPHPPWGSGEDGVKFFFIFRWFPSRLIYLPSLVRIHW